MDKIYITKIYTYFIYFLNAYCFPDLPDFGPRLIGINSKYKIGDQISAKCISPSSVPPVNLQWFVNGDHARQGQISSTIQNQSMANVSSLAWGRKSDPINLISTVSLKLMYAEEDV